MCPKIKEFYGTLSTHRQPVISLQDNLVDDLCVDNFISKLVLKFLSLIVRKPIFGVSDYLFRSDTNMALQPQKMARSLKFRV